MQTLSLTPDTAAPQYTLSDRADSEMDLTDCAHDFGMWSFAEDLCVTALFEHVWTQVEDAPGVLSSGDAEWPIFIGLRVEEEGRAYHVKPNEAPAWVGHDVLRDIEAGQFERVGNW